MVPQAVLLASALFLSIARAIELSLTGTPSPGQSITLTWDGLPPWAMNILTAENGDDAFSLYRTIDEITVTSGVWRVDVPIGTLVQFVVTDATGSPGFQYLQIVDDEVDGASTSSVASVSSVSVASTQSLASVSSASAASLSSLAATSTTSTTVAPTSAPTSASRTSRVQTVPSSSPPATLPAPTSSTPAGTDLPSQSAPSTGPSAGAVAGGVIGAILGLMIIAALFWLCRRHRQRQRAEAYGYPDHRSSGSNEKFNNFGHRRTLSRGQPQAVNWNPDQPHLTPNVNAIGGPDFFAATPPTRESPRASSVLRQFGEFITTPSAIPNNSLSLELAPPPPPAVTRPSVLDIARNAQKNDIPLYLPTSTQRANFGQDQPAYPQREQGQSPFADKFAVDGRYEPDLQDPAVTASYASATGQAPLGPPPRPPRPSRPVDLGLNAAPTPVAKDPATVARHRNSVSQIGPVPTVGHSRKISGPIPIVFENTQQDDRLPSWAVNNDDSRYPAITVQTPTTPSTTSGMAGVGAGLTRSMSGSVGRPIYPAAMGPAPPTRQQKRVSSQVQPPLGPRSPPTRPTPAGPRSPPVGPRSPPVGPRSPPSAARAQAMSPPPLALSPLQPPRRIAAEPDVPVTPNTPSLNAFPTPPRTLVPTGSMSSVDSAQAASTGAVGGHSPPSGKQHSLQPISTSLPYAANTTLSPISASPIPTPLASSTIASPDTSRFTTTNDLSRGATVSSHMTTSTGERMNIRRELQDGQDLPAIPQTPFTPGFNPNGITNYQSHPPMPSLPASFSPTFKSPVQTLSAEGWYEGRHISLAPTTVSNRQSSTGSARRLSDITTSGDAEWKELEKQLKWVNDEAHVLPQPRPSPNGTS